jgi:hypothetical protein
MAMRGVFSGIALVFLVSIVAACGGSSRLSASAYRAQLAKIGKQADKAQAQVEKALSAKSVAEIRARLSAFAKADDRLGDEVRRLNPPKNAHAANTELVRGEHDTASASRSAVAKLAKIKNVKEALSFLNSSLGNAKGAHELDQALSELKKLGYTKGS